MTTATLSRRREVSRHRRNLSVAGEVAPQPGAHGAAALSRSRPGDGPGERVEPQRLGDERERVRPAAVVAQVEQVVARHAVVLEVARAVVVRRAPEHHRRAEVVGGRVQELGVDHGGDPGAGALGAQTVLVVVAPDEELLARQPDPLDEVAGDQHAVERDHDVARSGRRAAARSTSAMPVHDAGAAGQPDREAQPGRVLLGDAPPAPRSRGPSRCQQQGQAVGVGEPVVVHQPGQVGAALDAPSRGRRGSRRRRRGCG